MTDTSTDQDAEHLRLLSIFQYVVAGMQALFGCFPIVHFVMGAFMVFAPTTFENGKAQAAPAVVGSFFMIFAAAWMLFAWTAAGCMVFAGRSLARRANYLFCMVVAAVETIICMPFGTVLGVFTIIVLVRPSVKEAFQAAGRPRPAELSP